MQYIVCFSLDACETSLCLSLAASEEFAPSNSYLEILSASTVQCIPEADKNC